MDPVDAPLVNVVMRTRNRGTLLRRAVADVLAQDDGRWTLTVVNDGGDPGVVDATVGEFVEQLGTRLILVHLAESSGMEHASNVGIASAGTPFVAIHDDDDTWHPSFLSRTIEWLGTHPDSPAVAVRTEIVWEAISDAGVTELGRELFLPELSQVTLGDLLRFNTCVPISVLYRRSALDGIGGFDESLEVTGDWHCNIRLAAIGEIGFLPETPLAFWRQRPAARGDLGNSVISLASRHHAADKLVRDRELRDYVASSGAGLPLYLTRYLDDRFDEMSARLDRIEHVVRDRFADRVIRAARRFRSRPKGDR